ncbi:transcriptional regulator, TetR family [Amycolatopsis marina]|uniref:Transcriptional regulator, TetR family n=1 Tax=Amycolatopsis marina TaxID=490629 RepID=A0A1I0XWG5_9PSEU|nr:TetR family transcriptional regulator [Amycolatopsis marina]SFB05479.1 transcriptional regulator, TetR family [Amycolatopsis marina]
MAADDEDTGLRERKKRETRIALSRAAIRLSIERGWDSVTVDDIAAAANVSPRTFRNYFASKAEAIASGHLERTSRIAEELRARPASEPLWEAILNAASSQFDLKRDSGGTAQTDQRWMDGLRVIVAEPAVQSEVLKANVAAQEELATAIADRTGTVAAQDLYPQLAAAVASAGIATAVQYWVRADPGGSAVPLLREVFTRIAAGLPSP